MENKSILMNKPKDLGNQGDILNDSETTKVPEDNEVISSPSVPATKTPETFQVSKEEWNLVMKTLSDLQKGTEATVTTQQKRYSGPRAYQYRIIDGKPIVHIDMFKNKVQKDLRTRGWIEEQEMEITYGDGSKERMLYGDYVQAYDYSTSTVPKRVENVVLVNFKDGRRPEQISEADFKAWYMTKVEGVNDPVIDWEIVSSVLNTDKYTFQVDGMNGGNEFTVDQTAIN